MKAYFGAGCFWGVESKFRMLDGVLSTSVGYSGGSVPDPNYELVCTGTTGHAEVVEIEYNESVITYDELLQVFWNVHDPTQLNRQGPDIGTQYRTVILYTSLEQKDNALKSITKEQKKYKLDITTQVEPIGDYYLAEDYHQQYLEKQGLSSCHVNLK